MKNTPAKSAAAKRASFAAQRAAFSSVRTAIPTFFDPVWRESTHKQGHKAANAYNKREKKVWRNI